MQIEPVCFVLHLIFDRLLSRLNLCLTCFSTVGLLSVAQVSTSSLLDPNECTAVFTLIQVPYIIAVLLNGHVDTVHRKELYT